MLPPLGMSPTTLLCDTACVCVSCAGTVWSWLRESHYLSSSSAAYLLPITEGKVQHDKFHMTAAVESMTTSPLRVVLPPTHSVCQTGCFAASAVCLLRSSLQEGCCLACMLLLICACGTALDRAHSPCNISSNSFESFSLAICLLHRHSRPQQNHSKGDVKTALMPQHSASGKSRMGAAVSPAGLRSSAASSASSRSRARLCRDQRASSCTEALPVISASLCALSSAVSCPVLQCSRPRGTGAGQGPEGRSSNSAASSHRHRYPPGTAEP